MTGPVLVAYASKHGSTAEVAEAVARVLREQALAVEVRPAGAVRDVSGYAGVVLGCALYMGRAHADARRFLARHHATLGARPLAVFGMGPGTTEPKDLQASRAQLDRALAAHGGTTPFSVAVFGGVVDPAKLRFPFSRMPATDARD